MRKKIESPTDAEIREMKSLCYSATRGAYTDIKRIGVLYRKYPKTFSEISDGEHRLAVDEIKNMFSK